MVRGGVASDGTKQPTPPQGEETMDFPVMPSEKGTGRSEKPVTPAHARQPSVTTSQIFKASPNVGGVEALEAKNPQTARITAKPMPSTPDVGSEALRKVLTEKIEKARTTARIRKNELRMQALDLEIRRGTSPLAGAAPISFGSHLIAYLPGLFLLLALVVLLVWYAFQQAN